MLSQVSTTLLDLVLVLRVLRLVVWAVALGINISAATRVLVGRSREDDVIRALMFFIAASEVGFASIWIANANLTPELHPATLISWVGMYLLSIMCGLSACWIVGASEKARRP